MAAQSVRDRLYRAYATSHAGVTAPGTGVYAFRRDILPHLPPDRSIRILDVGCGQGDLVRQLLSAGYHNTSGIDVSPEQVALAHASGLTQIKLGDFRNELESATYDVITATDFFEHLNLSEALDAADTIRSALKPGGILILRVPNGVSPLVGLYQHGDLTHETLYTGRSLRQLGAAAGYCNVRVFECSPAVHGLKSLIRRGVWMLASGTIKSALAAETGVLRGHCVTVNIVAVLQV